MKNYLLDVFGDNLQDCQTLKSLLEHESKKVRNRKKVQYLIRELEKKIAYFRIKI